MTLRQAAVSPPTMLLCAELVMSTPQNPLPSALVPVTSVPM